MTFALWLIAALLAIQTINRSVWYQKWRLLKKARKYTEFEWLSVNEKGVVALHKSFPKHYHVSAVSGWHVLQEGASQPFNGYYPNLRNQVIKL